MTQLTEHFSLEEMTVSETAARRGIDNTAPPEVLPQLRLLCERLELVRTLIDVPIRISSGYRCAALNAAIGGSANSAHQLGLAADFIAPPLSPVEICRMIETSSLAFDQLIYEHDWVHLAIGPGERRQKLTLTAGSGYIPGIVG